MNGQEPEPVQELSPEQEERWLDAIDRAEPNVFARVIAGKIETGTIRATSIELIDVHSRRLAVLGSTDDGKPGLAIFHPGSDRARAELLLDKDGPTLRLNNAAGHPRLQIYVSDDSRAGITMLDARGRLRISLLVDRGHPRLSVVRPGSRKHDVVATTPFSKAIPRRAWGRAVRAAEANQRTAFEKAAMACGFLSLELPDLWDFVRERLTATVTPEDTLRTAGIDDARRAKYQRRLSTLLAGREVDGPGKKGEA
jgi:hypothetical protein